MEFTNVKMVDDEEKSLSEKEADVIAAAKEEEVAVEAEPEVAEEAEAEAESELSETSVLSFIKNKFNKEVSSLEDLFKEKNSEVDIPEDVSAYMKFSKETGRGFEDFIKANRDFNQEDPNTLLKEYLSIKNPELDEEDIEFEMEKYEYDDFDEKREIAAKKVAYKKDIAEALDYFNKQKEQYKIPVASTVKGLPDDEKEAYEMFKQAQSQVATYEEENNAKVEYFKRKTDELLNEKFKGFEFQIDGKNLVYKPSDIAKIKEQQSNIGTFISSHVGENGLLKNAEAYHKAMVMASNPDMMAKFFYEQGAADATTNFAKDSKNIDMSGTRSSPQSISKGGLSVKMVEDDDDYSLKISSNRK
jgi:hypothetical protein